METLAVDKAVAKAAQVKMYSGSNRFVFFTPFLAESYSASAQFYA